MTSSSTQPLSGSAPNARSIAHQAFATYMATGDAGAAIRVIERGQARIQLSSLAGNDVSSLGLPPAAVGEDLRDALADLVVLQESPDMAPDSRSVSAEFATGPVENLRKIAQRVEEAIPDTTGPEEVAAWAEPAALIYLVATQFGGLVLTVSRDGQPHGLILDQLTEPAVLQRINTLRLETTRGWSGLVRQGELDSALQWLGEVVAPLNEILPEREWLLVPVGDMRLLPLHGAWQHDVSAATGRRYVIDDHVVRYAPSGRSVAPMPLPGVADVLPALAVFVEPSDAREEDVETLAAAYGPDLVVLSGAYATPATVRSYLERSGFVYFAANVRAGSPRRPGRGLVLANEELLELRDIIRTDLRRTQLVLLAGNGVGLDDNGNWPIGVADGFLLAGARAVIATAWSVPEVSVRAVVRRFVKECGDGTRPLEALRQAQLWLREVTWSEILDADLLGGAAEDRAFARFADPATRPFADPWYWVGFSYLGR